MPWWLLRSALFACALCIGSVCTASATRVVLEGSDIPSRLRIGTAFIFNASDTLYLNSRMLERGTDYSFVSGQGYFDLSRISLSDTDSLVVIFRPIPSWVRPTYGRPLPDATVESAPIPRTSADRSTAASSRAGREIKLSGAKSFRFSTRTGGTSDFGQSLDLNISGELTPGLKISGAITDRGYDPAYGTANSRLSELDKVNLQLMSRRLLAQLGDITIEKLPAQRTPKSVSGASVDVHYPNWNVSAAVARPRGQYESYALMGRNGTQGPYQIGQGTNVRPVVPGSETVWLDGRRLERGANNDYTMDYPTGRVTFNVGHPIDSRSRIEIDYEPQTTTFKRELLTVGGGIHLADSTVYFSVAALREGDDSEQPLVGDLSDDTRLLLAATGDSVATRSGVRGDTAGSYVLVIDSLPDTVYQYVGVGNGELTIVFSFVGDGMGDYRFLGNDRYQYVGLGQGDYLPVEIIASPARTDDYRAVVGLRSRVFGDIRADIRQTVYDQNLLSSLDDGDNDGLFYQLTAVRSWNWHRRENSASAMRRVRESRYRSRERFNEADFTRDYLVPVGFVATTDETLHRLTGTVSPDNSLVLTPSFSTLEYESSFSARRGGLSVLFEPSENVTMEAGWDELSSDIDSSDTSGDGSARTQVASVTLRPAAALTLFSRYEHDGREDDYTGVDRGARYNQWQAGLGYATESLRWEYYVEDSLAGDWARTLRRNRLTASSNRRYGYLTLAAQASYQWIRRTDSDQDSFLGRLNARYNNSGRRLSFLASYTISEEDRNSRGITYLEVEPGQGNYILEGAEYIPDPDGNYLKVEEILSASSSVRRAEKSFQFSKDWRVALLRMTSTIEEELLPDGDRSVWWALPFYVDDRQPYLFLSRRYNGDARLWPVSGFYVVNLTITHDTEIRQIAGDERRRLDYTGKLSLKQKIGNTHLEEIGGLFVSDRDDYYAGSGDIDGLKFSLTARQVFGFGEVSAGGGYRRAESTLDERSDTYSTTVGSRIRVLGQGELRATIELYRQDLKNVSGTPSYQLTDNRSGTEGAVWSLALKYGLRKGLRMSIDVSGRHSDDRTARITAKGEVVAGF